VVTLIDVVAEKLAISKCNRQVTERRLSET